MGSCSIVATEKKGIVVPQTFCHVVCTVNRYLWCLGVSLRSHHRCSRNLHLLQFILSRRDQFMGIFWKSKISINSLSACLYFSLYLFEMLEAFLNHLAAEFLHGRVHIVLFELRYQAGYGRLNSDHHSRDHLLLAPQQYDFCFPEILDRLYLLFQLGLSAIKTSLNLGCPIWLPLFTNMWAWSSWKCQ